MSSFQEGKDEEKKAFKKAVKKFDKETLSALSEVEKTWAGLNYSDEELDFKIDNFLSDIWFKGIKEDKLIVIDGYTFDVVQLIEPLKNLGKYCNTYPMLLEKYRRDKEKSQISKEVLEVISKKPDIKMGKKLVLKV